MVLHKYGSSKLFYVTKNIFDFAVTSFVKRSPVFCPVQEDANNEPRSKKSMVLTSDKQTSKIKSKLCIE